MTHNKDSTKTVITILSILGFMIAAYLTYLYYTNGNTGVCLSGSGCDSVRQSSYSSIVGIPVAMLGVAGYFLILIFNISTISNNTKLFFLYLLSLAGFTFSVYLTYIEIFLIRAICLYCLISAIIMICIFILVMIKKPISKIKLTKSIPVTLLLVLLIIFGAVFLQSRDEVGAVSDENLQTSLAHHLTKIGAAMYGSYKCPHCLTQKHVFGEAFKHLTYIECHPRVKHSNTSLCISKGIRSYPTWEINGNLYRGAKSLQELAIISGYSQP